MGFRVSSKKTRRMESVGARTRGFRRGRSGVQVRVLHRGRPVHPVVGGAMTLVWGQVSERCRWPTACATRVVAARRERAEVGASATERGREWWVPEGGVRRLLGVEGASLVWLAGSHRGWCDGLAEIGVVVLEPKAQKANLHRSCLRRSPPKWRSDFLVSEEVTSSATFDAGL